MLIGISIGGIITIISLKFDEIIAGHDVKIVNQLHRIIEPKVLGIFQRISGIIHGDVSIALSHNQAILIPEPGDSTEKIVESIAKRLFNYADQIADRNLYAIYSTLPDYSGAIIDIKQQVNNIIATLHSNSNALRYLLILIYAIENYELSRIMLRELSTNSAQILRGDREKYYVNSIRTIARHVLHYSNSK